MNLHVRIDIDAAMLRTIKPTSATVPLLVPPTVDATT